MRRPLISVRGLAAIAAVCALFCVGAASASAAPLVWTSNSVKNSVSTIDGATGKEVGKPIPVGKEPEQIAITPDCRRAIVVTSGGESAEVIDIANRKVLGSIPLPGEGEGVAVSPDGKAAFVTSKSEEVLVIDPETATVTGTVELEEESTPGVAFSPNGRLAYVGLATNKIVTVDTQTGKVVGSAIKLTAGRARLMAFSPDGDTAYVIGAGIGGIVVVDLALGQVVKTIPTPPEEPFGIAMSPSGERLYAGFSNSAAEAVSVINTTTNAVIGSPIALSEGVWEIAISPDGKTAYTSSNDEVTPIDLATKKAGTPIPMTGDGIFYLAIAPDQSPTAAFTSPSATAGTPATFGGAASTDPDGSIASYNWSFGDGGTATGVSATHTYDAAGTYQVKLSVVDSEGCGEEVVFTGRTAYCSGAAPAVHPVTVQTPSAIGQPAAPIAPIAAPGPPPNSFKFDRMIHNRRNGTVRLQVTLPSAGFVLLFGKKVHAVTRKSKGLQTMWLTVHARVELAKRLKQILQAQVRFRVTFTPNGGTPKTVWKTVSLQRAPRSKQRHHPH